MEENEIQRILVVEDLKSLQEHIAETISDMGEEYLVQTADDGREALDIIEASSQAFDLIVTDLTMPRVDGEMLLEKLRDMHFAGSVIVLTAHGQDDIIIRCLKAGACDYLVKPVGIEELQLAVSTALQHAPRIDDEFLVDFDPSGWFEIEGGSDYSMVYRFRRFLGLLDSFRLEEPVLAEVKLTLEELGRNAIEWGNENDKSKKVRFSCRILPYKILIQIADEGEGFNPHEVPDPSADPFGHIQQRQAEGKRLGGYGVHLIKNLMDKVTWNARGNVVMAIKYLTENQSAKVESVDSTN